MPRLWLAWQDFAWWNRRNWPTRSSGSRRGLSSTRPKPESAVRRRLHDHLGRDPADLPIVSRALAAWDRPNFQVAVDAWTAGCEVEVVGLPVMRATGPGWRSWCGERTGDSSSSWAPSST